MRSLVWLATAYALRAVASVLVVTSAAAPVSAEPTGRHPMTAERLGARVDAFWKEWQAQNLHALFLLHAPSYRRKTNEASFYELTRGMLGITPVEYKVVGIELSKDGAHAKVTLDAQTIIPPLGQVPNKLIQQWTYERGDWYRLMPSPSAPAVSPPPSTPGPAPGARPAAEPESK